jgi:hypothetical protein
MSAVIRAKVRVGYLLEGKSFDEKTNEVKKHNEQITLHGVYDPDPESENAKWCTATPALNLTMQINNPGAFDKLKTGKEYFLDFVEVEEKSEAAKG